MKVLITYDYGKEKIDKIREIGYEVILKKEHDLVCGEDLKDVDILVCYNPFSTLDIRQMKSLKWIQLSSMGFNQVPMEYVKASEIVVTNNHGGYSKPMGEWIVLSILENLKMKKKIYKNQEKRRWKMYSELLELTNRKVLFLGTGTIASEAAKRLQGFETTVHGVNTSGVANSYFDEVLLSKDLTEYIGGYDIIISTLPITDQTYHLIDHKMMNLMKDDAILINVSRGPIIHEKELIDQLERGKFRGVSLDVFEEEPLEEESPLWSYERVYISSHNSWISDLRNERRFETIYENLLRYKEEKRLKNIVNLERGY